MADDQFSSEGMVKLLGFHEMDEAAIEDVKLIAGKRLKRFSELCSGFEQVVLHLKKVHAQQHSEKYEIHARLTAKGTTYTSTTTDFNLMVAVEQVIARIESEVSKTRTA